MRSAFAILALAGLSQAKVFLFNAEKCNTNFDNEANWNNPDLGSDESTDTPMSAAKPSSVEFSAPSGNHKPVSVRVNQGEYAVGKIILQPNMRIQLEVEGVRLGFDSNANGAKAQFTAGQDTKNPACSLGCHNNFYEYLGRDMDEAADIDLKELNTHTEFDDGFAAVPAGRVPCDTDTVVIPKRYGINLLSLGFHPFKNIVYPHNEDSLVSVTAEEDIPAFMMFPTSNQKVFLGQDVLDDCADHGLLDDDDRCICISECPAPEDALEQSNRLRDSAKAFAQRELRSYNKDGQMERFDWSYGNAFEPTAINAYPCDLSQSAVAETVEKYTAGYLSSAGVRVEIDEEKAMIRASGRLTGRAGDFDGQKMIAGPVKILDAYEPLGSGVAATYPMEDVKDDTNMQLAMTVYHAVVDEMQKECKIRGSSDLLDNAGVTFVKGERTIVYAGNNLPQIDVNRMVDENNKAGIVDHVFEQVRTIQGFQDLSKDAMYGSWRLATPEDRTKGRRAARLGLATNLIQVNLEYSRWSTGSGVDKRHVERVVNHLLATYDLTTHHKCFTFDGGFDEECIRSLVAGAVQAKLDGCAPDKVRDCKDEASAVALAITLEIKGCGLLGSIPGKAGGDAVCADPEEEARRLAESEEYAESVSEFEVLAAEARHSSSVAAAVEAARVAAEELAGRIKDAGVARNASLSERAQQLAFDLAKAKSEALETASANTDLEEPVALAKAKVDAADGVVEDAEVALAECNAKPAADRGNDADCSGAENALFDAQDALAAAKETWYTLRKLQLQLLKQISDTADPEDDFAGLTPEQKAQIDDIVEDIEDELTEVREDIIAQQAVKDDAKKAFDDLNCVTMHDEIEGCNQAGLTLETARAKLNALTDEEVATVAALVEASTIQGSAKTKQEKGFFDETLHIIIVGFGVVILLIIVVGAVTVCGAAAGGAAAGGKNDWENDRLVVAFENPMYDDPNAGQQRGSMKRSASKKAKAAAAMADDGGGLYDEPAFNDEPEPAAGGGYLDVEPDDDDDEEEEESSEEESSEEDDDDDE